MIFVSSMYDAAQYYYSTLNWKLVPIPSGAKGPTSKGWNAVERAATPEHWANHPSDNMGVLLEPSNIVVMDIDNVEETKLLLETFGLNYDTIFNGCPRLRGNPEHDKAIFKAPDIKLKTHKLSWPNKDCLTDSHTVLEFRAGLVQDVLPPSIHPVTGKPYEWTTDPSEELPAVPEQILAIWKNWDAFKSELYNACPWAPKKIPPAKKTTATANEHDDDIIGRFNDANRISDIISRHGYKQISANRYLSPYSKTGLPGVIVFPDNKLFSHHGSEPFDTSRSHDAFDMFCQFECGGDMMLAIREAARSLGIQTRAEKEAEHGGAIVESLKKQKPGITSEEIESIKKTVSLCDNLPPLPEITHPLFRKWMDIGSRLMYSHQSYHFGNLLPIASMALGRRVGTLISTKYVYSNFYMMLVGTSTISGKSFSSDTAIQEFGIPVVNIPTLLNPVDSSALKRKSCSNPRLVQDLSKSNHMLWYYDEAKEFFDEAGERGWNAPIIGNLCTAYDGSQLENARSNKSNKPNEADNLWLCEHPFLSLLFNMTTDQLKEASTQKIVGSGFLFRWVWFLENGGEKKKNVTATKEDLDGISEIQKELVRIGTALKRLQPNDICFGVNEKIEQWSIEISKRSTDENYQSATGRSVMHVYKMAMIFSLFDPEFQKKVLGQEKYPIRVEFPDKWVDEAIKIVEGYLLPRVMLVVDYSDKIDTSNKQLHVLNSLRAFGGVAAHSELLKRTKLDSVDFAKAIKTLIESEEIKSVKQGTKTVYCIRL